MLNAAKYYVRRGAAWLRRRLLPAQASAQMPDVLPYSAWIGKRQLDRRQEYPAVLEKGLFSLLTPVFDPPSGFFRRLGKSILAQDHADWQWVIVDNGCRNSDVLYLMESFSRDARVTLVKAGEPRGIIGGMRLALEHARNRYVCPVDHDDQLYPDALRVVAVSLQAHEWPVLAYTDEDKLLPDGMPALPSFKPDWDPLLFLNAFYIAHWGVMDRATALELDIYSDPQAEGTPDGDAFCRFVAAGHTPLHIPEIVYSWRMHEQSTALRGVAAKPYVTANQKHVLNQYLNRCGLADKVTLRTNPLPGLAGSWRVESVADPIPVLVMPGGGHENRRQLRQRLKVSHNISKVRWLHASQNSWQEVLNEIRGHTWVMLLSPDCLPLTTDFVGECMAVQGALSDAVLVGGILQDDADKVVSAGLVWGFDTLMNSPLAGYSVNDYAVNQGALCFQRCVSSVDTRFCMVQVALLRETLERSGCDLADPLLPAWFGAVSREQATRVLFTPYVRGLIRDSGSPRQMDDEARYRFLCEFGHYLTSDPYYSRFLGLTAAIANQAVRPALRREVLQRGLSPLAEIEPDVEAWLGPRDAYPLWFTSERTADGNREERVEKQNGREVA